MFSSKEIGNYSVEFIDRPVEFGWPLFEDKKIRKVIMKL